MRDLNIDSHIWGYGEGDEQHDKLQCKNQFIEGPAKKISLAVQWWSLGTPEANAARSGI
jgi:hypothetical protein